ncbi:HAD-IC family P-type ATPase [Breoghania sp.]|uniref:HAD-IC family P-type ATPase n=1 Tax=Breoghania sp. TaxID=2065378 RepID=UPI00262641E8|nr:HAD-IC family P-type ATPase [Breoghania sp.]MDJ0932958.1 HAD-IC family P-type ATPase [Breoghania sp.]
MSAFRLTVRHDAVPGRLRAEVAGLCGNKAMAETLERRLAAFDEIGRARIRLQTGSVILDFDRRLSHAQILIRLEEALDALRDAPGADAVPTRQAVARGGGERPRATPHFGALSEIVRGQGVDPERGLDESEARDRLARFGPNALPEAQERSPVVIFLKQFDSLPILLLAGSIAVSLASGGVADAAAAMAVVAINGVLGYVTEVQAEPTIRRLVDSSQQECLVLRSGAERISAVRAIVPDDILLLRPGQYVAADARLTAADGLMIDESALTGESVAVIKAPDDGLHAETALSERRNIAFAGTLIVAGSGRAVVVVTGAGTEIAAIQQLADKAERPRAPIERDLDRISARLVGASLAACEVFFGLGWMRGYSLSVMLRDALALAVAVPEGLPTVATTMLARGIRQMEKSGILIGRLDVVESLGALQTLCFDKTGTLTVNSMVARVGEAGGVRFEANGAGLVPAGPDGDRVALDALLDVIVLNSEAEVTVAGAIDEAVSSATERALFQLAIDAGCGIRDRRATLPRLRYLDRENGRRFTASVHERDGDRLVTVKGSPADVLSMRARHSVDGAASRLMTLPAGDFWRATMRWRLFRRACSPLQAVPRRRAWVIWRRISSFWVLWRWSIRCDPERRISSPRSTGRVSPPR